MIILVTGMMLTFSRQAMLGVGMGVFVMLIGYFFKQRTPPYRLLTGMSIMIVPMILIGTLCTNLVATRLTGNAPLEQRSLVERSTYVDDSLRLLREQWLFGVGQGNYTAILERQDRSAGVTRSGFEYQPVHNVTLLIFTELGIPGLLAWLLLLISLLFPTHQITPPAPMQPWRLTMHAVLAALLIIGLFDHYLWSLHPGLLLLWLVIGLTVLSQDTKKRGSTANT
jgi:O-antigen ligase